jgi:hypothetical protein
LLASGVDEEYGESEQLLDELTSHLDEHARVESERNDREKARLERLASAGGVVRDAALSRMQEEEGRDERPAKRAKVSVLLSFLREDSENEAKRREAEFERQREERQAERQAEREERREERRLDHERTLALFKMFMEMAQSQK